MTPFSPAHLAAFLAALPCLALASVALVAETARQVAVARGEKARGDQ